MKSRQIPTIILLNFLPILLLAQVPKNVVVEHFTNTRCSICASRNPGFYTNLSNHPNILHIAYHPSSPYSNCVLNNHNIAENDDRTKYYNQYGSTPKFTIQGDNIPSSQNVSNPSLFSPYIGQTSPISLSVSHTKFNSDSMQIRVVTKAVSANSLGSQRLFVALAEDTIAYAAPNGENFHYDVFRKALTEIEGEQVSIPANIGDSLVFTFSSANNIDWTFKRIYALGILQNESTKEVIQASKSDSELTGSPVGLKEEESQNLSIYPNPVLDRLIVSSDDLIESMQLYTITGKMVLERTFNKRGLIEIDVHNRPSGVYFLQILSSGQLVTRKILIQ